MASRRITQGNKAEAVRQRRTQEGAKQKAKKTKRAQEMPIVQSAPIFVRRGVVGTPVIQRTRTQVKRKFAFPLQSGSEVVIPGLPMFRPGWRILSGFISISLLVFLSLINISSLFDVEDLTISGLQRVNPVDISNVLNLKGKPIYSIDPQKVLARMQETFPEFYDVEVEIAFPAVVSITLNERQPVISWQYENLTLWIDSEGNIFPPRGVAEGILTIYADAAPPRLKIPMTVEEIKTKKMELDGEGVGDVELKDGPVDPLFLQDALALKENLPDVSQLSYRKSDGFGWHDDANNWNVYFGHQLADLDQKLILYENIQDWILSKGIHPDLISVAYIRAPFYRLE